MHESLRRSLREAYDRKAQERDATTPPAWQAEERDAFLALLQQEQKRSLLELGAAAGADARLFRDHGFEVLCIDLSPEMVRRCQEKGLSALVMDVVDLDFPASSFDAVYAMNCLVHVPKPGLPDVLDRVSRVLKPDGLFYVGVYGGHEEAGTFDWDPYEPKRFFSFYTDDNLQCILERSFRIQAFRRIPHGWAGLHFQSCVMRKMK